MLFFSRRTKTSESWKTSIHRTEWEIRRNYSRMIRFTYFCIVGSLCIVLCFVEAWNDQWRTVKKQHNFTLILSTHICYVTRLSIIMKGNDKTSDDWNLEIKKFTESQKTKTTETKAMLCWTVIFTYTNLSHVWKFERIPALSPFQQPLSINTPIVHWIS